MSSSEADTGLQVGAGGPVARFAGLRNTVTAALRHSRRGSILLRNGKLAPGKPYAERVEHSPGMLDVAAELVIAKVADPTRRAIHDPARSLRRIVPAVAAHVETFKAASDEDLRQRARGMHARLRRAGFTERLVGECFALVSEAAARTIGFRHFETQLMAGWGLLQGKLVEMETGEGKTFAATLPACTVALAGYPVHVITVNDYLARRDAEEMGVLYRFLGLTAGAVQHTMDREARRQVHTKSVVYCTNKDIAFDYLRDSVALAGRTSRLHIGIEKLRGGKPMNAELILRGLYFAIVDEADSVFVDEAKTPLILSAAADEAEDDQTQSLEALAIAEALTEKLHYTVDVAEHRVILTDAGYDAVDAAAAELGPAWTSPRAREELATQALSAIHLFKRDVHYVVVDGSVKIVDESTGRLMPDRAWERGLHQLIEAKEGCKSTERRETMARVTYQRLFRRYVRLCGMTGTGREVASEIRLVYGLGFVRIPLHRPSLRKAYPPRICATDAEKWRLVAESVKDIAQDQGRPVLVGTRSVGASQEISRVLTALGIEHALLNALQDAAEAEIIAQAGQPGRVTVATNMAGRGTDIRLSAEVRDRGGLHVILTEYHNSRRVDRQLFGRCARQGDPGSRQVIVSLEDEIYTTHAATATKVVRARVLRGARVSSFMFTALQWLAQLSAERRGTEARIDNLHSDRELDKVLAFSGRRE